MLDRLKEEAGKFVNGLTVRSAFVRNIALIMATCMLVNGCVTPIYASAQVPTTGTVQKEETEAPPEVKKAIEELGANGSGTTLNAQNDGQNKAQDNTPKLMTANNADLGSSSQTGNASGSETDDEPVNLDGNVFDDTNASISEEDLLLFGAATIAVKVLYKRQLTDGSGQYESSSLKVETKNVTAGEEVLIEPDQDWINGQAEVNLYGFNRNVQPFYHTFTMPDEEVEFHFDARQLTVVYEKGNEDAPEPPKGTVLYVRNKLIVPEYGSEFPGYTFEGYDVKYASDPATVERKQPEDEIEWSDDIDDTLTLTAVWEPIPVTINYDIPEAQKTFGHLKRDSVSAKHFQDNIGAASPSSEVHSVTATPSDGYHFVKWEGLRYDDELKTNPKAITIANPTDKELNAVQTSAKGIYEYADYTASFAENKVTVAFDANGKPAVPSTIPGTITNITYSGDSKIPNENAECAGYTFEGWSQNSGATKGDPSILATGSSLNFLAKEETDKAFTYYAIWTSNKYSIKYLDQGNKPFSGTHTSIDYPTEFSFDETVTLDSATKNGYTFGGWFLEDDCSGTAVTELTKNTYSYNVILYAKWTPVTYNITYNLKGGSVAVPNPKEYTIESESFTLNNPTRVGSNFDGWSVTGSTATSSTITIVKGSTGDRSYDANWEFQTYSITYKDKDNKDFSGVHETVYPVTHTYGAETTLDNPTNTGYTFKGWFYEASCTGTAVTKVGAEAKSADFTLYALWEANKYTITFDANGGTGTPFTQEATYNEWAAFKNNTYTRNGFVFVGWDKNSAATEPEYKNCDTFTNLTSGEPITLYAIWKKGTYNLAYDLKGGELKHGGQNNPHTYDIDTATFTLLNPSKLYYDFLGWTGGINGEIVEPTPTITIEQGTPSTTYADRSYVASWSATEYTITYDYNYTSFMATPSNPTKYSVETATFTLNNPTREGYTFAGWTGTALSDKTMSVTIPKGSTGNRSYTANWSAISYKFTLDRNGHGVAPAASWILYNTPLTEPASLSEIGWEFTGWYRESGCVNKFDFTDAKMPAKDLTLYAGWVKGTYTLTYDMQGHGTTPTPASITAKYGENITAPANPTADGYSFRGWYKDAALTQAFVFDTMPGQDTVVYAGWDELSYTVTYELNYDDKRENVSRKFSEGATLLTPAREGYIFGGWFEDNGTFQDPFTNLEALALAGTTTVKTVYATWSEGAYDFIYDLQDGSWAKNEPTEGGWIDPATKKKWKISRDFQKSITLEHADNVVRYGYKFINWYTSAEYAKVFSANDARDLARTTKDQTVYAKWEENRSTITYKSYVGGTAAVHGSSAADFEYIYSKSGKYVLGGGSVQGGEVTVTPGYAFKGWIKDDEEGIYCKKQHLEPEDLAKNKTTEEYLTATYIATFSENEYSVTFKDGETVIDGNIIKPVEDIDYKHISYTQVIQLPYDPGITKDGFRFIGWSIDGAFRTPGQQVNCLTTEAGEDVTISTVWTANNVEIVYYTDGLGSVSRDKDIIASDNYDGLTSISAIDSVPGYTFAEWQFTTAAGVPASYSEVTLTPKQIADAAWNSEKQCYQKVELKACFKEIYYTIRYCASVEDLIKYPDTKTVVTGPYSYNDTITLLTWDQLSKEPYNQIAFEIKGADFAGWNEYKDGVATGKTYIDQQVVSCLATGSEIALVTERTPKTAVHEYGAIGGGGNLIADGETASDLYKFYEESYATSARTVRANPGAAYVLDNWQIYDKNYKSNDGYRNITESDPVTATGYRTKNASVTPKKVQYGGDEAYDSFKVRATFCLKNVTVNFHDSNSDVVKYYQIASVSSDQTVKAHDYTVMGLATPTEPGTWVFAGWSFNKGNDEENILIPNKGYLDFATDQYPTYPDVVDLYAVWTKYDQPMQIVYHQSIGGYNWEDDENWWITRKVVDANLTGPFGSKATSSTACAHLITEEEAKPNEYYWIGWYYSSDVRDSTYITNEYTVIPTRSQTAGDDIYKFPNVSSDGNVHIYAIWGHKPYTHPVMPVTVHYQGHVPNNAPEDYKGAGQYTIATQSYQTDEPLRETNSINKSGWPMVFGTNVLTPTSSDGYKFDGWYIDAEYTRKWVFNDDIGKSTGNTQVGSSRKDIYAKWNEPDKTTLAYYSGKHGTAHVMNADYTPSKQGYELVNEIGTPLASGSVVEPDTGYHLDKWEGTVVSRDVPYVFNVPENWIFGPNRTLMRPLPTNPNEHSGTMYEKTNYKAIYAPNTYKLGFYDENEVLISSDLIDDPNDPPVDFATISYDQSFKLPEGQNILAARGNKFRGYSFKGWIATESGASYLKGMTVINLTPVQSKEVGLKAEWEENTVYISYENDEYGVVHVTGMPENVKTEHIKAVSGDYATGSEGKIKGATTIPEPGYHFDHWTGRAYSDDDDKIGYDLTITAKGDYFKPVPTGTPSDAAKVYEKTYYMAHFAPDKYKVIFHNYYDGEDHATYSQEGFIFNEAKELTPNTFTREGFSFVGWATCSNGESVLDDKALVKDIEEIVDGRGTGKADLYAVWRNVAYYLAYDTVGGTEIQTKYYIFQQDVPYPASPSKSGYEFMFWTDKDDNIATVVSQMPAKNLVYTASWSELSYNFTYNPNGATWSDLSRESKTEKRPFTQWVELKSGNELSRTGYVFGGWYTTPEYSASTIFTQANANALANSTKSQTVYAGWIPSDQTRYKIKHIRQNVEGIYDDSLVEMQEVDSKGQYLMGTTGGSTNINDPDKRAEYIKTYTGFEPGAYQDASISEDGSAVAERKYERLKFNFAYDMQGMGTQITTKSVYYEADISATGLKLDASPSDTVTGYEFKGWYTHSLLDPVSKTYSVPYVFSTMPADNVTVFAKWEPIKYSIRFNKNAETATGSMADQPFTYDIAQPLYENSYKNSGYEFKGWTTAAISKVVAYQDKQSVKNLAVTKDYIIDLFALWEPNAYKITFDHDGGTSTTNQITATYSESIPNISTPSKTGYTFLGYYDEPHGAGKQYYDNEGHPTGTGIWDKPNDATLYAKWEANGYTVIFDGNNKTSGETKDQQFTYDVEQMLRENGYSRTGYTYQGWADESTSVTPKYADKATVSNLVPSGSKTIYAVWKANNYRIIFDKKGGTGGDDETTATFDQPMPDIATPSKVGYSFTGYATESKSYYTSEGTSDNNWDRAVDSVLVADWVAKLYVAKLNHMGGSSGGSTAETYIAPTYDADMPTVATPSKEGYNFQGYYSLENGVGTKYYDENGYSAHIWDRDEENVTLYAFWTPKTYVVYFNDHNDTPVTKFVYATFSEAMPDTSTPSKTGYTFGGYYSDYGVYDNQYYDATGSNIRDWDIDEENPVLHAKWTANKYYVHFDGNKNTSGSMSDQEFTYDVTEPLNDNKYKRTGYTWQWWELKGSKATYSNLQEVTNLKSKNGDVATLKAKWNANQYKVTFKPQFVEGSIGRVTGTEELIVTFDSKMTTIVSPSCTGYTFLGYYDADGNKYFNGDGSYYRKWDKAGDTELYGKWKENTYEFVYHYLNDSDPKQLFDDVVVPIDRHYTKTLAQEIVGVKAVNTPTVPGYKFNKWLIATESSTELNPSTIKEEMTGSAYGSWTQNKYRMKYHENYDTNRTSKEFTLDYEELFDVCSNKFVPISDSGTQEWLRTGYTVPYWTPNSDGTGKRYVPGTKDSEVGTEADQLYYLYAYWLPNTYYINYDGNPGSASTVADLSTPSRTECTYDQPVTLGSTPTLPGYTFGGWYRDAACTVPVGSASQTIASPSANYVTEPNGSITFYAQWTPNNYTVHFASNSATGGSMSDQGFVFDDDEKALKLNGFEKTGYTWQYWQRSNVETATYSNAQHVKNLTETPNGVVTLNAIWKANPYTVTLVDDPGHGGSGSVTAVYDSDMPEVTVPKYTGYTFGGYFYESTSSGAQYYNADGTSHRKWNKATDSTLIAKWTPNPYKVVYDGNKKGTMSQTPKVPQSTNHKYDADVVLSSDTPTMKGYDFKGWFEDTECTGVGYATGSNIGVKNYTATANETHTLYAKWKPKTYTLSFNTHDGTPSDIPDRSIVFDQQYGELPVVTRVGYDFVGWFTATASGTEIVSDSQIITDSDHTLHAHWQLITYDIEYKKSQGGATPIDLESKDYRKKGKYPDSYDYEHNVPTISLPEPKDGYNLVGWYESTSSPSQATTSYSIPAHTKHEDITLIARYDILELRAYVDYCVGGYDPDDATKSQTRTYIYNVEHKPTLCEHPVRPTYPWQYFDGWTRVLGSSTTTIASNSVVELQFEDSGATFTAIWTNYKYDLTYDLDGGTNSPLNPDKYEYRDTDLVLASASKTGYTFVGWYDDAEFTIASPSVSAHSWGHPIKKYARFTPNNYKVEYYGNKNTGGTMATQSFVYDDTVERKLTTNAFTRTGYAFQGWDTDPAGTTVVHTNEKVVKNLTTEPDGMISLYAVWKANTYDVTLDQNGGSGGTTLIHPVYDLAMPVATMPTREGYDFTGYYDQKTGGTQYYTSTGNSARHWDKTSVPTTLYAHWNPHTYTVEFKGNTNTGGSMATMSFTYGVAQNLLANGFTKTGYHFMGWDTNSAGTNVVHTEQKSVKNLTSVDKATVYLYAVWAPNTYEVTLDNRGGSPTEATISVTFDEKVPGVTPPTRTGYVFKGYWDEPIGGNQYHNDGGTGIKNWASPSNGILYAHWQANTYEVQFHQNGGTGTDMPLQPFTYDVEQQLDQNTYSRVGYTYLGWDKASTATTPTYLDKATVSNLTSDVNGHVDLYAIWKANQYTITYEQDDATTKGTLSKVATFNEALPEIIVPSRTGYTFSGYYLATDNETTKYYNGDGSRVKSQWDIAADTTLHAKWTPIVYTITLHPEGGISSVPSVLATYSEPMPNAPKPTRTGYTFLGYYDATSSTAKKYIDEDGNGVGDWDKPEHGNLYAKWQANSYKVTFKPEGGIDPVPATKSVIFDSAYGDLAVTSKVGFDFDGWYTDASGGTKVTSNIKVSNASDHNLFAHWTPSANTKYTVEHYGDNIEGTEWSVIATDSKTGTTGTTGTADFRTDITGFTASPSDTRNIKNGTIEPDGSLVLKLYYLRNTYTVQFASGSEIIEIQHIRHGAKIPSYPEIATKSHYDILGWGTLSELWKFDEYTVKGDMTLVPMYKPHEYKLTYDLQGGYAVNPSTYTIETYPGILLNNPTRSGYKFKGWIVDGIGEPQIDVVIMPGSTGDRHFTAVWEAVPSSGGGGGGGYTPQAYVYSRPGEGKESKGNWIPVDIQNRFWKLRLDDGSLAKNGWVKVKNPYSTWGSDAKWYHFNEEGYMDTGWIKFQPDEWYYLWDEVDGNLGTLLHGWHHDKQDKYTYYLDLKTGRCYQGWNKIDGKWYYFSTLADVQLTDWVWNAARYVNPDNPSQKIGGWVATTVCIQPFGSMWINKVTPDGHRTGPDGALIGNVDPTIVKPHTFESEAIWQR